MRGRASLAAVLLALAGCGRGGETRIVCWDPPSAQAVEAERLGMPKTFENDVGMRFALVPAGTFVMGRDEGGDDVHHEAQMLVSFYVQTDETTWGQWKAVLGGAARVPPGTRDADPAVGVTHEEAALFSTALTERDPRWRYRLPTEAEWERAARAEGEPAPAAGEDRNAWGFAGTASGPWEWCSDRWAPYPIHPVSNPTGAATGEERVLRGGPPPAGSSDPVALRRRARSAPPPPDAGVRLVATLSYGKADLGAGVVTFVAVDGPAAEGSPKAPDGAYEVRLVAVFDRLYTRQQNLKPLPWVTLRGRAPLTIRVPPGRYYAQAQEPGGGPGTRGVEEKLTVVAGEKRVEVPIPRPGQTLDDPQ